MIPHIKRIKDKLSKTTTTGESLFFILTLKKGHEKDKGLIAHELTHVKQWWRVFLAAVALSCAAFYFGQAAWIFPILVFGFFGHNAATRIRAYRKYAEVEAFRAHVKAGRDIDEAALSLSRYYDLDISQDEARALLK